MKLDQPDDFDDDLGVPLLTVDTGDHIDEEIIQKSPNTIDVPTGDNVISPDQNMEIPSAES